MRRGRCVRAAMQAHLHIEEPYFYGAKFAYYPVMFVSHWNAEDYWRWTETPANRGGMGESSARRDRFAAVAVG